MPEPTRQRLSRRDSDKTRFFWRLGLIGNRQGKEASLTAYTWTERRESIKVKTDARNQLVRGPGERERQEKQKGS